MSQSNSTYWKAMGIAFLIHFPLSLIAWGVLIFACGWTWLDHWYVRMPVNMVTLLFVYAKVAVRMEKKQQLKDLGL